MKNKNISRILFVLLSGLALLSAFMIGKDFLIQQKEMDEFTAILDFATIQETIPSKVVETDMPLDVFEEPAEERKRDLSGLFAANSDCIGWLSIPGTAVDYPVMHTPDDPQKYLHRSFYGEYSYSGVPFLDSRCSFDSSNLIVYGHNMKNGTMFSALRHYVNKDFYTEHPIIELETAEECGHYTVFAVMKSTANDSWYSFITAENKEDFDEHMDSINAKALYDTGVVPLYGQQLLTLSTCYGSDKNGRLLILAVKV